VKRVFPFLALLILIDAFPLHLAASDCDDVHRASGERGTPAEKHFRPIFPTAEGENLLWAESSVLPKEWAQNGAALEDLVLSIAYRKSEAAALPQADRRKRESALDALEAKALVALSHLSPAEVRRAAERFWPHERRLDELMKLNELLLTIQDRAAANQLAQPQDVTYVGSPHSYYASSYSSFESYDRALAIPDGGTVVELGAGPLRGALYYAIKRPGVKLIGYELVASRVEAGRQAIRQLGTQLDHSIEQADLSRPDVPIADADGYILMHPFSYPTTENILAQLREKAERKNRTFRLVIFEYADVTRKVAQRQKWLKCEGHWAPRTGLKYGFSVFATQSPP